MRWTKPEFKEITLNMEVTAYVNTEGEVRKAATQESLVISHWSIVKNQMTDDQMTNG